MRRGRTVADVAQQAALDRGRLRRVLKGTDGLLVDELITLSQVLQLAPSDLGVDADDIPAAATAAPGLRLVDVDAPAQVAPSVSVDPWGNHVEQLFRVGFGLACDFFFLSDAAQLMESGVPDSVLSRFRGKDLPIKLDAAFHRHMDPQYGEHGIRLVLSFDTLRACTFPWAAVRQVVFFPAPVEAAPVEPERPKLRLV